MIVPILGRLEDLAEPVIIIEKFVKINTLAASLSPDIRHEDVVAGRRLGIDLIIIGRLGIPAKMANMILEGICGRSSLLGLSNVTIFSGRPKWEMTNTFRSKR
jgi:hypothetical protein